MIPIRMNKFLRDVLPERTWHNRLQRDGSRGYMEFGPTDVDRLHRLGIEVDRLGPRLVVCMWDEKSPLEVGGYLVVDNLAMGRPAMGGIRMLPDLTPAAVHNLARGMTLKNAAADLPYGGGKSGIVGGADLSPADHTEVIRCFAHLIDRYRDIYLPGPDVGTNDADMKTIAIENGLDCALSKPVEMGGNRIDQLGGAAGGVVIAIHTLLDEMARLKVLPQFADLQVPARADLTVLIQGFGAVGAHVAAMLHAGSQSPRILGVSDHAGYLFCSDKLPVEELLQLREQHGIVTFPYFEMHLVGGRSGRSSIKFSNCANDLLRESAFCLVPAAPVATYLAVDPDANASMTVDRMGRWRLIVEGANTYSPDPARRAARARMERAVYWQSGVLIATDYLVNSGGVIFAAQEHTIPTPAALQIPPDRRGNREAVDRWLGDHNAEFEQLAEARRMAGESRRDQVMQRNMKELIDLLVADTDLLPCEAAERISIGRIATSERDRTAADIMEPLPAIAQHRTVGEAARQLVETRYDMLAVVDDAERLVGIITDWDITRASAAAPNGRGDFAGSAQDVPLSQVMTRDVIAVHPDETILDVVHRLEYHEISAMPVVRDGRAVGVISGDILARRTLYRLLQAEG